MSIHDGHRMRLISKIQSGALQEHEYLEVLLFNAIPRMNTNDLAHRLLARFGTVKNLFSASMEDLQQVQGIGPSVAAYLKCIGHFYENYVRKKVVEYVDEYKQESFFAYLRERFSGEEQEIFEVYFMDKDKIIFGKQAITAEMGHQVKFSTEWFAKKLVECFPAGVVIVHNHPFGEANPSKKDDQTTEYCQVVCEAHNVLFCDHIIFGKDGFFSYYASGKMKKDSTGIFSKE